MRKIVLALALSLAVAASASAYTVRYKATWEPPIDSDGKPMQVTDYNLYICNQPIKPLFSDPTVTEGSMIAECPNGDMQVHTTNKLEYLGVYESVKPSGTLYFRATSRLVFEGETYESKMTDEVRFDYNTVVVTVPGPPRGFKIEGESTTEVVK